MDGTTVLTSKTLNQELSPDDFTADGSTWESLGDFIVTGDTLTVRLTDAANEFVIADAVRVERIEPAPEVTVKLDGVEVSDVSGAVDFGAVLAGDATTKTFTVKNTGLADLFLPGAINVPNGFSVVQSFTQTTLAAGESTGEALWRMPLGSSYDKMLDSRFADMKNLGGRDSGSITAAQFIKRFVDDVPWAHLDIAGVAMSSPASDINRSWGSGFGVRLLDRLVSDKFED